MITDDGKTLGTEYEDILHAGYSQPAFYQDNVNALIYSSDLGLVGGIIVQNTTPANWLGISASPEEEGQVPPG